MTGCVQGLLATYKAGAVAGKLCTSIQVSVGCCTSTAVCAAANFGGGASCSPAVPEGQGWTTNC